MPTQVATLASTSSAGVTLALATEGRELPMVTLALTG